MPILGTQASQISGHLANEVVAIAEWGSPYIGAYPWTDASGFGTKYADPATAVPDRGNQVRWSPDKKAIGIAHDTSPYVSVYAWSDALGFGTKYANPGTTPTGSGQSINFSADNSNIVVGHATSPYIYLPILGQAVLGLELSILTRVNYLTLKEVQLQVLLLTR